MWSSEPVERSGSAEWEACLREVVGWGFGGLLDWGVLAAGCGFWRGEEERFWMGRRLDGRGCRLMGWIGVEVMSLTSTQYGTRFAVERRK